MAELTRIPLARPLGVVDSFCNGSQWSPSPGYLGPVVSLPYPLSGMAGPSDSSNE